VLRARSSVAAGAPPAIVCVVRPALVLFVALSAAAPQADAQCRRSCAPGEERDAYGCCIERPRPRPRRATTELRPEALVGNASAALLPDATAETYEWARSALERARNARISQRLRATHFYRQAASFALVFLSIAPSDPRAGRMRATLVEALDGAGMILDAEREAAALGGARPDESPEMRSMRAYMVLNLAWAHQSVGGTLDTSSLVVPNDRTRARYRRAADYYGLYVESFPDAAERPGAQSELANVLIAAGEHERGVQVLDELAAAVPGRRADALRRLIDFHRNRLAQDVAAGRVALRSDPPPPSQRPPFAPVIPFPEALGRLFDARERYLRAVESTREPLQWRSQQLENALWLYRYGHWEETERRLDALLTERCDDGVARNAWIILGEMGRPTEGEATADVCSARRRAICSGTPDAPECVARAPR
jgi:tetratricopeptide (TPR) repeat protein